MTIPADVPSAGIWSSAVIVDLQANPAALAWGEFVEVALAAEAAGFAAFHVYDHFAGVALGGDTMLECFTLLGALTQVTSTIELGTMVVNVWNRQVGVAVAAAASVAILADRPTHLGIGAGTAPASQWAIEQRAVDADLESDIAVRHRRVAQFIDLADAQWRVDRDEQFATFPLPTVRPSIIVGVNSIALSELAGSKAAGVNVRWTHPRAVQFLEAARRAAGDRPCALTAYAEWNRDLLDAEHPERVAMAAAGIERLILVVSQGRPDLPDRVV